MQENINTLRLLLKRPLPGAEAQYQMAAKHRPIISVQDLNPGEYRHSAVMILFCEDSTGEWFIPLTERMSYNGAHSAQISFPGGKRDAADQSLEQTALRECFEEIGINNIEILGQLTELYIPVSKFLVQPFVGICREKNPKMVNHEREVKTILKLYLHDLLEDSIIKEGRIDIFNNMSIQSQWFDVDGHKVWGATAMILNELKTILKNSGQ